MSSCIDKNTHTNRTKTPSAKENFFFFLKMDMEKVKFIIILMVKDPTPNVKLHFGHFTKKNKQINHYILNQRVIWYFLKISPFSSVKNWRD